MLSRKVCFIAGSILWAAALTAPASAAEPAGSGPNPFSDCGIGAALFPTVKWAAVLSNVIWDVGTTAVISATASPQTCNGKKVAAALFINTTYASLTEETAAGKGEHLSAVLDILGCANQRRPQAIQAIRDQVGQWVAQPQYLLQTQRQKVEGLYNFIDTSVTTACTA